MRELMGYTLVRPDKSGHLLPTKREKVEIILRIGNHVGFFAPIPSALGTRPTSFTAIHLARATPLISPQSNRYESSPGDLTVCASGSLHFYQGCHRHKPNATPQK